MFAYLSLPETCLQFEFFACETKINNDKKSLFLHGNATFFGDFKLMLISKSL